MTKPKVTNIHHIAIAVNDIDDALTFWRDALGLELEAVEKVESQAVKIAMLPIEDSEIELVQPVTADSGIKRYMDKRGPGIHHICLEVDDIDAMLERLNGKNVRLINETAQEDGLAGRKFAFIHPESAQGVLVELYELTK